MDLISCVENFCKSHPEYSFTVRFHEPIAEKTTFKIGGTSLVFCEPNNLNSFCGFLEFLIIKKIKYFVYGRECRHRVDGGYSRLRGSRSVRPIGR